jgi:4-amino-4-deoxy-L-arabinose transferase-like glycosyltransferase
MKIPPIDRLPSFRVSIFQLIAVTTVLRLAFAATTGLGVDESYMVTAGRVLSLGYFDHPPASWWLSWGAAHLLGSEAPVVVRLPFILLFAASQWLMWRLGTMMMGDQRTGFWAAAALNASPVFGVTTGSWVLPDGPLDAALLGAVLCLMNAAPGAERSRQWWAGAGICAGLALFSKYSAILSIGGAFVYLVISPAHRHWLQRMEPYAAVGLAGLVFLPVLAWNALHGWSSFAFQGDRAMGLQFRPWLPLVTLGGEALFVLPWLWVPMMDALIRGFRSAWRPLLLACVAAPPIVGFALISAWSSQRVLYHWAAPGYLMLFPLIGGRPWVRRVVPGSAVLVIIVLAVIVGQVQFDWLGGRLAGVMRTDPTAEGVNWVSIRDDLRARGLLGPGTVVAALNWRDAGKIGYALGPDVTMLCLNEDSRQFGFAHPVRDYVGRDVLVLAVDSSGAGAGAWFRSVETLAPSSVRLDGRVLRTVTVLRGMGLRAER